ncbi:tubulin binding cofactor, partial [Opisthorchis viverrini]
YKPLEVDEKYNRYVTSDRGRERGEQFRARDCENIIVLLACATEPIIEASSGMKFGPYQCLYEELDAQFKSAGLSIFNCNWSEIYDFTQDTGAESNFELLGPEEADARKYMLTPKEALENESKKNDSQT